MSKSAIGLALLAAWLLAPGEARAAPLTGAGLPAVLAKFGCTFQERKLVCGDLDEILSHKEDGGKGTNTPNPGTDDAGGGAGQAPADANAGGAGGGTADGTEEASGEHSCPVGSVVLAEPNAAGSFCEPVPGREQTAEQRSCPAGYVVLGEANKYGALCEPVEGFPTAPVQSLAKKRVRRH
jgi:hypothetical protein